MQEFRPPISDLKIPDAEFIREFYTGETKEEVFAKMDAAVERHRKQGNTLVRRVKIGRNDPCPCNSGKKFKKCCLGLAR